MQHFSRPKIYIFPARFPNPGKDPRPGRGKTHFAPPVLRGPVPRFSALRDTAGRDAGTTCKDNNLWHFTAILPRHEKRRWGKKRRAGHGEASSRKKDRYRRAKRKRMFFPEADRKILPNFISFVGMYKYPPSMKRSVFLLAWACLSVCGCSLLKFTMDTGDEPLPRAQINVRTMVRAFYKDFSGSLAQSADSIYRSTDSLEIKLRAIQWKIDATSRCADAAYGTIPEIALLNTWAMCGSMDRYMSEAPDSALFGALSPLARECAARQHEKIESVARQSLDEARFARMKEFIAGHTAAGMPSSQQDLMLRWVDFLGVADSSYIVTTGSVAQSIADVSEKASGYSAQWGNELSWNKDLLTTRLSTQEARREIRARMDSLQSQFDRVVAVAENTPAIASEMLDELNEQFSELMSRADASMDRVFTDLDHQRDQLQAFVDSQRVRLMADADSLSAHTVRAAMEALPGVIGRLTLYLTAAFVVLFSIPFVSGYLIGRARGRKKAASRADETPEPDKR